jgi:hypothetical protein
MSASSPDLARVSRATLPRYDAPFLAEQADGSIALMDVAGRRSGGLCRRDIEGGFGSMLLYVPRGFGV